MIKKNIMGTVIVAIFIGITVYFYSPSAYRSYVKLQKLELEEKNLKIKIEKIKLKIESYSHKIDIMENEFEREKIARNRLQMIKENEEIYRFINKK